jgi:hypothetical protein
MLLHAVKIVTVEDSLVSILIRSPDHMKALKAETIDS